jgi:hypothetical protein
MTIRAVLMAMQKYSCKLGSHDYIITKAENIADADFMWHIEEKCWCCGQKNSGFTGNPRMRWW